MNADSSHIKEYSSLEEPNLFKEKNEELNALLKQYQNVLQEKERELAQAKTVIERQEEIIKILMNTYDKMDNYKRSFIEKFCIPQYFPKIVCQSLGLYWKGAPYFLVKFAEKRNLFCSLILAMRIPRTEEQQENKSRTTVLFSVLGCHVLQILLLDQKKENIKNMEYVSDVEQKEIESLLKEMDLPFKK